jgi:hypothetical protein
MPCTVTPERNDWKNFLDAVRAYQVSYLAGSREWPTLLNSKVHEMPQCSHTYDSATRPLPLSAANLKLLVNHL